MSKFAPSVISAAQRAQHELAVPASVSLAQFAIESAYGTKMPAGSNNPFGIKAVAGQPSVVARTREVVRGQSIFINAPFRKFADFNEAFEAHAHLLATAPVYAPAMTAWKAGHYEDGIRLMAAKYATAPDYATLLLSVIHSQNLQQYDS